jgi:hypothetical protein
VDVRWPLAWLVGALVGGALLAVDQVVSLPSPLIGVGVLLVVAGVGGLAAGAWRQSRQTGHGFLRTTGEVVGQSIRLLLSLLMG